MPANSALKMAIFESGRSQFVIGVDAGIYEARMSKIVRGHVQPTPEEQDALAGILGLPRASLFPPDSSHDAATPETPDEPSSEPADLAGGDAVRSGR